MRINYLEFRNHRNEIVKVVRGVSLYELLSVNFSYEPEQHIALELLGRVPANLKSGHYRKNSQYVIERKGWKLTFSVELHKREHEYVFVQLDDTLQSLHLEESKHLISDYPIEMLMSLWDAVYIKRTITTPANARVQNHQWTLTPTQYGFIKHDGEVVEVESLKALESFLTPLTLYRLETAWSHHCKHYTPYSTLMTKQKGIFHFNVEYGQLMVTIEYIATRPLDAPQQRSFTATRNWG